MLKTHPIVPPISPLSFSAKSAVDTQSAPGRWLQRCAQAFLLAWLLASVVNALTAAYWFNGYPVNGPFQLYDPLRRIAAGQHAGQDFQFFHGIGIPFLHYPLFWLFGAHSLQASELSRQFTSLLLFTVSLGLFVKAAMRSAADRLIHSAWVLGAVAILLLEITFPHSAEPGHSLISGRSTMPVVAFALLLMPLRLVRKAILFGICIGCALAFGTEHGLSLILALTGITGALVLLSLGRKSWRVAASYVRFFAVSLFTALLTAAILFLAIAGPVGARAALHYNLSELPLDQFWFFGSPPMPYLTSLTQLVTDRHAFACFLPSFFLLGIVVSLLAFEARRKAGGNDLVEPHPGSTWPSLGLLMLTYGLLTATPLIGILSRHYVYPQTRISILFVIVLITRIHRSQWESLLGKVLRYQRQCGMALATLFILLGAGLLYRTLDAGERLLQHQAVVARFDPNLDQYWNGFMAEATKVIDGHRTQPTLKLWSEYAALLDAHYENFQPAEDYIIHAIGAERWRHYLQEFRRTEPEFVTTMTSQFSFAEWLQDERWDFYQALIDNYDPIADVAHATIWQRRQSEWKVASEVWTNAKTDAPNLELTLAPAANSGEMVVVQLHYAAKNPWKKLPLIGTTPRFVGHVFGTDRNLAISLPPYAEVFRFPVKLSSSHPVTIRFAAESFLPGAELRIESAEFRPLPSTPATARLFTPRQIPSRY